MRVRAWPTGVANERGWDAASMTIVACPTAAPCNARVQGHATLATPGRFPCLGSRRSQGTFCYVIVVMRFLHLSLPTLSMLICAGVLGAIILDCGILECHQCWETESIMRLTR